jgi:biotin carboxyl carrier protein
MSDPAVERVGDGVYVVTVDGRQELVYVAGTADAVWAFRDGRTFLVRPESAARPGRGRARGGRAETLVAPMPATVIKVLAAPGTAVRKGDTVVLLEAMKMELPVRAAGDGVVKAIHCREGALVKPDEALVEFEE